MVLRSYYLNLVVLSMDTVDFSRDGIEHVHLPDFLLADKDGDSE